MFYEKTNLSNGLTIISEHIPGVRSVTLGIWFKVGSRDERPTQLGLSHFMEHMMFKGTEKRSVLDISTAFDAMGAELNAFTSKEYTCYHARVRDEHLDAALEILSDMVLNSQFSTRAINTEREVVLEEIARYQDEPGDHVGELFTEALYPTHALGRSVLGTREIVGNFKRSDCKNYLKQHYHAGNAVVVCAGNVEHASLVKLCKKHLAAMAGGKPNARDEVLEPKRGLLAFETRKTEQAHLLYGMPGIPLADTDRYAAQIMTTALGGPMSSRLFQEIREKRGLAYAVYAANLPYVNAGEFFCYVGTRPDNLAEVLSILRLEFERLSSDGVSRRELERVREYLIGQQVLAAESTRNHMMRLGASAVQGLEIVSLDESIERLHAVTVRDVKRVARRILCEEPTVAVVSPLKTRELKALVTAP